MIWSSRVDSRVKIAVELLRESLHLWDHVGVKASVVCHGGCFFS
jgi:hypothetical protein